VWGTGKGGEREAVGGVEWGAGGFLQKPGGLGKRWVLIENALRKRRSVMEGRQYCQQTLQVELSGRSEWMNQFRQRLQQLAETDISVWFYGEHGTGRMTGPGYLHQRGRNEKGPVVLLSLAPGTAGNVETF
ncbi:sigma 54-interacting transcriptional regulator, partial [Salmonella enterica]|uniref:sigma 54-interacting transcriptional regulator n=1 Tax=Salmonella enterica TaxID=28901 RepID=UPI00398C6795